MNSRPSGPDWFVQRVRLAETLSNEIGIVLVVNVRGRTEILDDYSEDSIVSDFLHDEELDDLVAGFEKAGIYCEVVQDEEGFQYWLTNGRPLFPRPQPLVLNLAQNGIGPARLSLVPGLCRLSRLPLVDSDVYAVAIARHKFHYSVILRGVGLPAARSWWFTQRGWWPGPPPNGAILIYKPTFESASIGVHEDSVFEMDANADTRLMHRLAVYRQPLTVQEFVQGFEIEVPVFDAEGPRTIIAVGIEANGQRNFRKSFLTCDQIATDRYSFYDFGTEDQTAALEAMRVAREAFQGLGLSGIGRVDFRIPSDGRPTIIDIACKPHIATHSGVMHAVKSAGGSHSDLLKFLVGSAAHRHGIGASRQPRIERP